MPRREEKDNGEIKRKKIKEQMEFLKGNNKDKHMNK
jgi:hypothetical protein